MLVAWFGNRSSLIFVGLLIAGSILYSVLFKGLTKKIIAFKSFYVSFFWASLSLLFILYYALPINLAVISLFAFIFMRLLVNTIFFDIKDIESDQRRGLKTLPICLGRDGVIAFIWVINLLSFAPILLCVYTGVLPVDSLVLLLFFFYSGHYLHLAQGKRADIQQLSYILVDGEYILWPISLLLLKFFKSL